MPATGAPRIDRSSLPDASGHFGPYGGIFVPETLMAALEELQGVYAKARVDPEFQAEFRRHLADFAGRPTPLGNQAPDRKATTSGAGCQHGNAQASSDGLK